MLFSKEAGGVALRSVGTAMTLASAGFYLQSRGFVKDEQITAFGQYIKHVGLPLYFFTKLVECPSSNHIDDTGVSSCPNVLYHWSKASWILLVWPIYVVGWGVLVGYIMAWLTKTPIRQHRTVMMTTAFGNSGSLCTTLLAVLHEHASATAGDVHLDPNTFLSLYLVLYPVLAWSLGFWLLHPVESSCDSRAYPPSASNEKAVVTEETGLLRDDEEGTVPPNKRRHANSNGANTKETQWLEKFWLSTSMVMKQACQPPAIGSLLGLAVTTVAPLRALLAASNHSAPLDWWFDGLCKLGYSSIPVNLAVLGMHLSSSLKKQQRQDQNNSTDEKKMKMSNIDLFGWKTMAGILVGKLVVLPMIGFASFVVMRDYLGVVSSPSLSVVLLIVWIPPTATNSVVLADLAGGMKEAVAQLMVWQYLVVPLVLSLSMAFVVHLSGLNVS